MNPPGTGIPSRDSRSDRDERERKSTLHAVGMLGNMGFIVAVAVAFGVLTGQWIDKHFGTGRTWTLVGALLGLGGAAAEVVRTLRRFIQNDAPGPQGPKPPPPGPPGEDRHAGESNAGGATPGPGDNRPAGPGP